MISPNAAAMNQVTIPVTDDQEQELAAEVEENKAQ